jgi:hypothetical protein
MQLYATVLVLYCNYMQLMQLYCNLCNYNATILQQFRMQLYANMQLYVTMQHATYAT